MDIILIHYYRGGGGEYGRYDSALKQYILLQVFHVISESRMELEKEKAKAMARIVPVI